MSPIATIELEGHQQRGIFVETAKVNSPDGEFNDYDVFYRCSDPEIEADLTDGKILEIKRGKKENPETLFLDDVPVEKVVFEKGVKVVPHFS